ncbi:hypothetical protein [Sodaliphilus sp.]|uniref:hypothetical protein n=1 Tax=Sodaliphilus sp. TaxID=2815818 RepID=UPI00388EA250
MKNRIAKLFVVALMLQSCAHTARYVESSYDCNDSPYPIVSMPFAYNVAGKGIPENLAKLGDKIHNDVKSDSHYQEMLPSAISLVESKSTERDNFNHAVAKASSVKYDSQLGYKNAVSNLDALLSELSRYDFKENYEKAYQLSHRGIIQHYVNNSSEFKGLSTKDKELVYGQILKADHADCINLAESCVKKDEQEISTLKKAVTTVKNKYEEAEKARLLTEKKKRIEEEKKRIEEEKREQARKDAEARKKQEEQAQKRMKDLSWIKGCWLSETDIASVMKGGPQQYQIGISSSGITIQYMSGNNWYTKCKGRYNFSTDGRYIVVNGESIKIDYWNGCLLYEGRYFNRVGGWYY